MDVTIIIYILAIILGIVGLMAFGRGKKQKVLGMNKNLAGVLGLGIAIFLITFQMGYLVGYGLNPLASGVSTTRQPTQVPGAPLTTGGQCVGIEDTTVTLSAIDAYTNAPAGTTHRYRINTNPAKTLSDAGTFTASPGDALNILWGNETDGNYFGATDSVTVPCSGTATFSKELYQNGTVTIRVFNEEGNLIADPENETLAAGDVVNLDMDIQGQFQRGFPHGGIMVAEYDSANYSTVKVQLGGSEVAVPNIHTLSSTANTAKAYSIAPLLSNDKISGTLYIETKSGVNPSSLCDVTLSFYVNDYFINEDTGGSYDGPDVEDEDDARAFQHKTSKTVDID